VESFENTLHRIIFPRLGYIEPSQRIKHRIHPQQSMNWKKIVMVSPFATFFKTLRCNWVMAVGHPAGFVYPYSDHSDLKLLDLLL